MTETLAPVAPEIVTPVKPSEALRLGRLTRPVRLTGDWLLPGAACAYGAIVTGGGAWEMHGLLDAAAPAACPAVSDFAWSSRFRYERCGMRKPEWTVESLVWHLNDQHEWDDAQIVAWLEGLGL